MLSVLWPEDATKAKVRGIMSALRGWWGQHNLKYGGWPIRKGAQEAGPVIELIMSCRSQTSVDADGQGLFETGQEAKLPRNERDDAAQGA